MFIRFLPLHPPRPNKMSPGFWEVIPSSWTRLLPRLERILKKSYNPPTGSKALEKVSRRRRFGGACDGNHEVVELVLFFVALRPPLMARLRSEWSSPLIFESIIGGVRAGKESKSELFGVVSVRGPIKNSIRLDSL